MASSSLALALGLFLISSMAAAATATAAEPAPHHKKQKMSHIHLYTSNVTTYAVAGLNRSSSPSIFGDVFVYDPPLTARPSPGSKVLGRGQGMAVGVSQTDAALLTSINMVFTAGKHKGSSLAMYGGVDGAGVGDRPVVGGSGKFRMARGYALSRITQMTPYVVVEFDIYVWHH